MRDCISLQQVLKNNINSPMRHVIFDPILTNSYSSERSIQSIDWPIGKDSLYPNLFYPRNQLLISIYSFAVVRAFVLVLNLKLDQYRLFTFPAVINL
jgi:hypothetical protein